MNTKRTNNGVQSIAVIDDHDVVLEGMKGVLMKQGYPQVDVFHTASELLATLPQHGYDIYVVDVELPDMSCSDFIDRIRALHADARIVINTIHDEIWVVNTLQEKQVDAVLYKSGDLSQLLAAIDAVGHGKRYFCDQFSRLATKNKMKVEHPSKRENDVLQQIALGKSTAEIASALYISENTVETHRQSLFRKLKAHNVAELMVKAIACGYIDPRAAVYKC